MRIRLQKSEDAPELARLHKATICNICSQDYPEDIITNWWSTRSNAQRFRKLKDRKRWVAVEKNKIIGFCDHDFEGELTGLYVHKDFQGQGVATRLLEKVESSMRKLGFKKSKLESTITAKAFYESQGYKVIKKTFHDINGKKARTFIMEKKLKPNPKK